MQARPLVERFHVLCVSCLVLDALFCLIFTFSALSASNSELDSTCDSASTDNTWHNIVATSVSISALASLWGCFVHGAVACSTPSVPVTAAKIQSVSRYGHVLVAWTFIAAVLEAIANREQPDGCSQTANGAIDLASAQGQSDFLWQVGSTLLWLAWICSAVASAVLGRRTAPIVAAAEAAPRDVQESELEAGPCPPAAMPQLVGVPVQQLQGNAAFGGSLDADSAGVTPTTGTLVSGVPLHGVPLGASHSAGLPANGMVAQGTPVDSSVGHSSSKV